MRRWDAEALAQMPTLEAGSCADLKVETAALRVWLCRDGHGVTVEEYQPRTGSWEKSGNCEVKK